MSDDRPSYGRSGEAIPGSDSIAPSLTSLNYYRDEAAPQVLNIPGAVYTECNSQIEAFAELGRVTMAGRKRVLRPDGSEDVSSQATGRPRRQGGGSQVVSTRNDTRVRARGDNSLEETIIQCPPTSSSQLRSTIQRTGTLPPQQPQSSQNNLVQRSRTVPNLDTNPVQSNQSERSPRPQNPPASNVGHSEVTSAPADAPTTGDEGTLSSPATNVPATPGSAFRPRFPSSPPRETPPSRSFPTNQGDRGDADQASPQRGGGSGTHEEHHNHRTPAARSVRGSESSARTVSVLPPETATNGSAIPVLSTTLCEPTREVVQDSPSSANPSPSIQRGTSNSTSDPPRGGNNPPPSSPGSSQLTYVSDDERPTGDLAQPINDPGYYTPLSRNSEMPDANSESPGQASRRPLPTPPSSPPNQGSSGQEPYPTLPSLSTGVPTQIPNSQSSSHRGNRGDGNLSPPRSQNGIDHQQSCGQTPANDPSQVFGQDVCHCTDPCPSCHKPRLPPYLPQFYQSMFQHYASYYPHGYFPPSHMQTGFQPSHWGPPPHPYPYPTPQPTDPIPSISSAQPIPPTPGYPIPTGLATYPSANHSLGASVRASLTPAPVPAPSISTPASPHPLVSGISPVDPPATNRVSPEHSEALDQLYQPLQRRVVVVDPTYDPRSPYSRGSTVPASPNR